VFITTDSLTAGSIGVPFQQQLSATGGVPPYMWSIVDGNLAPGLALDATSGLITGTPSAAGNFSFTVRVTDSRSTTSQKQASITIISQPLAILTASLQVAVAGSPYTQQLA